MIPEFKSYLREFKRHWLSYLLLLMLFDLFNQFILIPLLRYITTFVLQAGAIPFVSYQNVVTIITTHTIVFVILILELLLLLFLIYVQLVVLLLSIKTIASDNFELKTIFHLTWQRIKKTRLSTLLLVTMYFLILVPLADIVFRTPLLAKIQISEFILDYLTRTPLLLGILVAFYLIIICLGARWVLALPLIIYRQEKPLAAIKSSWQLTKNGNWWSLLSRMLVVAISTAIVLVIFYGLIYGLQLIWDLFPGKYLPMTLAILNLTLIQIVSAIVLAGVIVVFTLILLRGIKLLPKGKSSFITNKKTIFIAVLAALIIVASSVFTNSLYLTGTNGKRLLIISHRGVSDQNGVQNTIPALTKTVKLKPDYVEIDLHETKDHQFVVLHDENLAKLTGVNKAPSELTLKELTQLTAKENGHQAKITSFDQYLKAAQRHKQKLLLEIKTTPKDSKKMLQNFNRKYAATILRDHYQVQSLDYRVVEGLHQINSKLKVLYIQPYNFTYPHSVADGYSMEYSTLNTDFVWQAHLKQHPVYAWTINDEKLMKKMMYGQVDGLITDNVTLAKKAIKAYQADTSYAQRILNYLIVVHVSGNLEV
ncbi:MULTISPECIES: glycerophosphoryl diester phosphodiesterase membrane domain-containing protein [Lactobacillus]|uniref:Glycerophosphodiester phosphodiesterase n=1 Tax=Lactobacillus xujianguonis TaxID=2495899 RepID=A0A437SVX0_9LACO|nr:MULTISPECIES: glycerophosphodiester phosphodiesterase [Lactobacillus]RVU71076.1 glycerophosphodiester phosphodiesterase [Lactobacillus xujianguonis]RVU76768.1 glycerophosphodiester phosphodiesterase [Lactobacillus xujianguonis]